MTDIAPTSLDTTGRSIYKMCTTHLLGTTTITPKWHTAHTTDDGIKYLQHHRFTLSPVARALRLQYPDEHFWMDYITALCKWDIDLQLPLLRSSADLGNPYAAFEYATTLGYKNKSEILSADERDVILKFYKIAADIGHCGAVVGMIYHITNHTSIKAYCGTLSRSVPDGNATHEFIGLLLRYIRVLIHAVHQLQDDCIKRRYCVLIYHTYLCAHVYKYPLPAGTMPWLLQSYAYIGYDYDDRNSACDLSTQFQSMACELWDSLQTAQQTIAQLRTLNSMSLDEVCKDVVKEYCTADKP